MAMMRLVVHIDRLVLNGFQPQDGAPVAEGVRNTLVDMLATRDIARKIGRLRDVARLSAGSIRPGPGEMALQVGRRIGRAVAERVVS